MELGGARQAAGGEELSRILPRCEACELQLGKRFMAVIRATNCLLIGWSMLHRIERVPGTITLVKSLPSGRSGALVG